MNPLFIFTRDLQLGSVGIEVFKLQQILEKLSIEDFIPTGYYGPKTFQAVRKFQVKNGIDSVGVVGPQTRSRLNSMLSSSGEFFYWVARGCLGRDASPDDEAPDDVACAETISDVHELAFGFRIGGGVSTTKMYQWMLSSPRFEKVKDPKRGDIVISPSGFGNGVLSNGHIGVMGEYGKIMSNYSPTGEFLEYYDIPKWVARYVLKGGYPMDFFRIVA